VRPGHGAGELVPTVVRWSELICNMVPTIDKVRYTQLRHGSVMMAIRVARGITGKDLLLKTDGCYHGSYDPVVFPSIQEVFLRALRKTPSSSVQ